MSEDLAVLLREIRDNQREALAMQREHMALYVKQLERVERINDKAALMQTRAGRFLWLLIPLIALCALLIAWPYARWLWWWLSA